MMDGFDADYSIAAAVSCCCWLAEEILIIFGDGLIDGWMILHFVLM